MQRHGPLVQCIADDSRGEDLDLVAGQTRPSIEYLEHGVSPWRMFVLSGRRAYIPPVPGKLRFRRGERKPIETRGTCALERARASTKSSK